MTSLAFSEDCAATNQAVHGINRDYVAVIRRLMASNSISLRKLASLTNISKSRLSNLLHGDPCKRTSMTLIEFEKILNALNINVLPRQRPKVFLVHIGDQAKKRSLVLLEEFRKENILVLESLGKDSFNAQLRKADKEEAALALIFGQKEVFEESIIIRDMKTGAQETVPLKKIISAIKKRI